MEERIASAKRNVEYLTGKLAQTYGLINRDYVGKELAAAQARLDALIAQKSRSGSES